MIMAPLPKIKKKQNSKIFKDTFIIYIIYSYVNNASILYYIILFVYYIHNVYTNTNMFYERNQIYIKYTIYERII